jgi:NADH-quinone oxidoreductase subunit H
MTTWHELVALLLFPGGLALVLGSLAYEWADHKLIARFQNRVGPRPIQPLADLLKLLAKEEIVPAGVNRWLFYALPMLALAGALTAALYVPLAGLAPAHSFPGDLIVTVYLLSLLTLCTGVAGMITADRFSLVGALRALTQLFSYEAPFLLALLTPAISTGSWQISEIATAEAGSAGAWRLVSAPVGFVVALIGLIGKLEFPPFDAPEAETEIVAGALTEYSGRGLAFFRLCRAVELVVGLTLIAALYLGGVANVIDFTLKTGGLLALLVILQVVLARLRIDQTARLWWQWGAMLALAQVLLLVIIAG